jgi:demethylmenaquinone methyltransferase/2-methoxy-6-polyprenyl-1,4-benzoquinol methylase
MAEDSSAQHRRSIEPHPVLPAYYQKAEQRPAFVRDLFNKTAPQYDRINQLFLFNSGAWYRGRALQQAGLRPGMRVLDLATGTGLVAREAIAITGSTANVIGLDMSEGMLAEARRRLDIPLVQGGMECLPLADDSVDFISMGYALRHIGDLAAAFRELHRVLRPGGKLLILEIGRPSTPLRQALVGFYLGRLFPLLCRWKTGREETQTLMRYYWHTIDSCVSPETIVGGLERAGFSRVACHVELDIFRSYVGRK